MKSILSNLDNKNINLQKANMTIEQEQESYIKAEKHLWRLKNLRITMIKIEIAESSKKRR